MDPITQQILEKQKAIQATPGFGGYQPSSSSLDKGITALTPMGVQKDTVGISGFGYQPSGVPNIGQIAKNIAINKAIDYGVTKIGLPQIAGTLLGSVLAPGISVVSLPGFNAFSGIASLNTKMQSSLFGRSKTIAEFLEARREQKAAAAAKARASAIAQEQANRDAARGAAAAAAQAAANREARRSSQYGGGGNSSGGSGDSNSPAGGGGYCFDPNTPVQMADGSEKKIKDIQLGDATKGGEVTGVFQFKAADEIHDYKGVTVAGSHYVKEDGKFIMVKDSPIAIKIDKIPVVHSLDTSGRRIFIKDIEFADYNGDGIAKGFLTNAGVDLSGFDKEVLRQVENRLI